MLKQGSDFLFEISVFEITEVEITRVDCIFKFEEMSFEANEASIKYSMNDIYESS